MAEKEKRLKKLTDTKYVKGIPSVNGTKRRHGCEEQPGALIRAPVSYIAILESSFTTHDLGFW